MTCISQARSRKRAVIDLCRCREMLGPDYQLTNEQLESLRDQLATLAHIALEMGLQELRKGAKSVLDMAAGIVPEEQREEIRERASIMEFEGGLQRTESERAAIKNQRPRQRSSQRIN
jgi:hypothetical protein